MKQTFLRVSLAAALIPGWAWAQQKSPAPQKNSTTVQKTADRVDTGRNAKLEREVRHELLTEVPQYGVFDFITFNVSGNTVTLNGDVTLPVIKNNAEKAVKGIEGVEKVVNNINVLPVYSTDNAIRIAAYQAVYGAPALQRYAFQAIPSIHIIVNNGNIRLEGAVANKADADNALVRVKAIPNTFQVSSNLKTDAQLAAIEERRK